MLFSHSDHYSQTNNQLDAKPYCQCWSKKRAPVQWKHLYSCVCGEDNVVNEWKWQQPEGVRWVVVSEDNKQVTFHPVYSSGTAAIKGDTPLHNDYHYYWEVKMLTETYGTDIMVGIGSNKVNISDFEFSFTSLLGLDAESYGLSYTGAVRHDAAVSRYSAGFCKGTIVGVRVDMWRGTLEFYVNRKPQGISFYNLRRHQLLYPMLSSTAAQSSMRLIYAASWQASLFVDAARILAASARKQTWRRLPPGLLYKIRPHFWMTFARDGCILDADEEKEQADEEEEGMEVELDMDAEAVKVAANMLGEMVPSPHMNGFYVDNVDRVYRIVVWE